MTPDVERRLEFAKDMLTEAEWALSRAGLVRSAARNAYLAALSAARALILARTGKVPKTHTGTRSELSRIAHADPRIDREFTRFLADGFELKSWADYDEGRRRILTTVETAEVVATAARLVAHAEWLLAQPEPPVGP